jgi:superfamily II DNA/RNA helicase
MSGRPTTSRSSSAGYRGRPRRSGGSSTSRPAPAPVKSDLELALDAAADAAAAQPDTATTFAALGLPERLVIALARRGMEAPFAIQTRAIPDALTGRDVLGRGATGSGKTLAFGLPMLARLSTSRNGERLRGTPRGLVLVPTRELAQQVSDALAPLAQALDLKVTTVYGGASMGRQIDQLRRGVDVVVATPGRLQDLIEQRECTLAQLEITVLDEADHMADLGFMPAVTALLDMTAPGTQRLLFSATLDRGVDKLVRQYLVDPAIHAVATAESHVTTMDHRVYAVQGDAKVDIAAEIAARPGRTLFFVRTKHGADRLAMQMRKVGVEAAAIHGNLTQNARKRALEDFASGHARVLVATDVAARGIHVDDVDLVVHYDPPRDDKGYLHRSGRTARAGNRGTVVSLVDRAQARPLARVHLGAGVQATSHSVRPGHAAVRELATSGIPV